MVTINFTIVVQLVLFLTFLWVTNKLVLRPILRVMDERDRTNRENQEASERDTERAQKLESDYAAQIASARRQGVVTVEKARREALNERMQALAARKQVAEEQVAAVHREAMGHVDTARGSYAQLAPALISDIATRLQVDLDRQKGTDS
jgi:F-type H+-transporting ATPase subunit b